MNKLIDQSTQKVTKLITELRPEILDNLGLLPALEWQVEDLREHRGISCRFHSTVKELALKDELSTAIFRIFQEALTNVARHSKATEVDISLEKINDYLRLRIIDNGIGLSEDQLKDSERFGLIGMKERAKVFGGSVEIEGKKEKGTRVEVRIPIS
ncbi:MAG: hypothetical protein GWN16_15450 [Calditrichae bacterium]|nr:hypothetical protein [Calditrichia bacterium]